MSTSPSLQAEAAMQRIRQHISRSAGQHLRAVRSTATPSMTPEPLLLNTERLHRVDASQLPAGTGVSLGHCRTDMGICMGHPECADRHCQGHPCSDDGFDVPESERDGPLLLKVLIGYALFLLACGWSAWQLIQWLSR